MENEKENRRFFRKKCPGMKEWGKGSAPGMDEKINSAL